MGTAGNASVEFMLREFHRKFGLEVNDHPIDFSFEAEFPKHELFELRRRLIDEEFNEVVLAHEGEDLVELAKELCDLVVVVVGTAVSYGIPFDECFAEVHRSNMSKLGNDGRPIYNEFGKVLKGPNYSPANLREIIYGNAGTEANS
jgi:predicted HAD superfamily Cof-like phosphohydrolase